MEMYVALGQLLHFLYYGFANICFLTYTFKGDFGFTL